MKMVTLNVPSFAFVVGTRALLGAGIGLLAAGSLAGARRRTLGKALVALGAASTIPGIWAVRRGARRASAQLTSNRVEQDDRLRGATRFPRKGDDQP